MNRNNLDNLGEKNIRLLKLSRVVCYIILIILTLLCLFSFYILIINSTRAHPDIQKGFSFFPGGSFSNNISELMTNENLPVMRAILNSLFVSSGCAILATYFSALTAFGIHAYNFRFKKIAFAFIMLIMMVPTQISALGFVKLMGDFGLINTLYPLIIPSVATPVVFYFMISYMQSALPVEIVEAARIDGSGEFRTFNKMVIPIMKPALAVQAIFTFVAAWNNYFIPTLIINTSEMKTIPLLVAQLRNADYMKFDMGQVYMLISIAIVPVIIVYLILSKYIVRGVTLGSVKG